VNRTCDQDQLKRELQVNSQKFRAQRKEHVVLRDVTWSRKKKLKLQKKPATRLRRRVEDIGLLVAELRHYLFGWQH